MLFMSKIIFHYGQAQNSWKIVEVIFLLFQGRELSQQVKNSLRGGIVPPKQDTSFFKEFNCQIS